MLQIFFTFREALFLGMRNFWFLVILNLVTRLPDAFLDKFSHSTKHSQSPVVVCMGIAGMFLGLLLIAVKQAAILGLLKRPATEMAIWAPVWVSIKTYSWALFRLSLLLAGIALLWAIPLFFLIKLFGSVKVVAFLIAAIYLVFLKYALAEPLVSMKTWALAQRCS